MKRFTLSLLLICISISGCLQEAAYIENQSQIQHNNKISNSKSTNYKEFNKSNQHIFSDEINLNSNKDNFIDINPYESNNNNSNNDSELTWNNIFQEPIIKKNDNNKNTKKDSQPNKSINNKTSQTSQLKKPIENNKLNTTKTSINTPPNPKPSSTSNTNKNLTDSLQIRKPVNGMIITKYGKNAENDLNEGISFKMNTDDVFAVADGRVIYIDSTGNNNQTIIIKHNNGLVASYSYRGQIKVENNQNVKTGQIIGKANQDLNRKILYFTLRQNGKLINPEKIIK